MRKITEQDLQGRGVMGLPDTPGLSREQMQEKFEETARQVIVPAFNELVDELGGAQGASAIGIDPIDGFDAENVQAALGAVKGYVDEKIIATGAADMQAGVYDPTHKERDIFAYADEAAEAVVGKTFVLSCTTTDTTHALTGLNGAEGLLTCAFTADADFAEGNTFTVDGNEYAVMMQDGSDAKAGLFVAGAKVQVLIDTEGQSVNFKAAGGKGGTKKYFLSVASADSTLQMVETTIPYEGKPAYLIAAAGYQYNVQMSAFTEMPKKGLGVGFQAANQFTSNEMGMVTQTEWNGGQVKVTFDYANHTIKLGVKSGMYMDASNSWVVFIRAGVELITEEE